MTYHTQDGAQSAQCDQMAPASLSTSSLTHLSLRSTLKSHALSYPPLPFWKKLKEAGCLTLPAEGTRGVCDFTLNCSYLQRALEGCVCVCVILNCSYLQRALEGCVCVCERERERERFYFKLFLPLPFFVEYSGLSFWILLVFLHSISQATCLHGFQAAKVTREPAILIPCLFFLPSPPTPVSVCC